MEKTNDTQDFTERELELMKELAKAKRYLAVFKKFLLNNGNKYFRADIFTEELFNNIVYIISGPVFDNIDFYRLIDSYYPEDRKIFIGDINGFKEYLKPFKEDEDYILLDKDYIPLDF